jgi:hypothetical protein
MRCSELYGNIERSAEMIGLLVRGLTDCRQTEDQLMRDMLASTSSFINCTGGTDGRQNGFIAVFKSSLIDLELLAA